MNRKTIAIATLGVFLLGMLVAIPTASAQKPDFSFSFSKSGIEGPLEPLVTKSFTIDYEYTVRVPVQNLAGAQGSATVTFDISCPAEVTITGARSEVIPVNPSQTEVTYTGDMQFDLVVNREARALDPLTCDVDGTVSAVQEQGVPAPDGQSNSFTIQADYFGLIEAKTDVKLKQGGPQKQIPFNIEVTNFGNGQTKVSFEVLEKPSGKWQGLVPDQLLLDEAGGERQSANAVFTVVTPFKNGWNNEEGAFTVQLSPEYSFNSEKTGSDVTMNLVARVRGVYVPTLEPMIMLGAVIGTALVARLMRE